MLLESVSLGFHSILRLYVVCGRNVVSGHSVVSGVSRTVTGPREGGHLPKSESPNRDGSVASAEANRSATRSEPSADRLLPALFDEIRQRDVLDPNPAIPGVRVELAIERG